MFCIVFVVVIYFFVVLSFVDLFFELGDELYIIEEIFDGDWFCGYLVLLLSLFVGLISVKGYIFEVCVFSGIFLWSCVEVCEVFGESDEIDDNEVDSEDGVVIDFLYIGSDFVKGGLVFNGEKKRRKDRNRGL